MSYEIPDNFKGSTGYNVNNFTIPGLMPTTNPVYDSQVFANPDGTIAFELFSVGDIEDIAYPFPVSLTSLDKRLLLLDTDGEHLFYNTKLDGRTYISFVIDGETKAIPVGQTELAVNVSGAYKKWIVVNNDTPFNLGKGSEFRYNDAERPLRYVIKNTYEIPAGTTTMFVPFEPNFVYAPQTVLGKVLDDAGVNPVGLTISNIISDGFTITFPAATSQDYTLEYVAWSLSVPLIVSGFAVTAEEFRIDPDILLVG